MGTKSHKTATGWTLNRPDRTRPVVPTVEPEPLIGRCERPVTCHRTRPVVVSPFWNLSVLHQTLLPYVRSVSLPTSGRPDYRATGPASGCPDCRATGPLSGCPNCRATGPAFGCPDCRATGPVSGRPDCRATSIRSPLQARFFVILHTAWFQSSCLDFA